MTAPQPDVTSNPDAEKAVLGAVLDGGGEAVMLRIPNASEDLFDNPQNLVIWGVICRMSADRERIDLLTVKARLTQEGQLKKAGGSSHISSLTDAVPDVSNVESYVRILERCAKQRAILVACKKASEAVTENKAPEETIAKLFATVGEQATPQKMQAAPIWEVAAETVAKMTDLSEKNISLSLPTSWEHFDRMKIFVPTFSVMGGHSKTGKALAIDTMIPTPSGWTLMGDLQVGDYVFDEFGVPTEVIATSQVMSGHRCYKVTFSDKSEIVCDEEHEWLTCTRKAFTSAHDAKHHPRVNGSVKRYGKDQSHLRTYPGVVTTKSIADTLVAPSGGANHYVQVARALQLPLAVLPLDPYVLGAWLGDGATAGGTITSADLEVISRIRSAGLTVNKTKSKYAWGIIGLRVILRELGVLGNKRIPQRYLRSSVSQRMELLRGLMDTDGYIDIKGRCELVSTQKVLADDAFELMASLGLRPTMRTGFAKLYGRVIGPKYTLGFTPDDDTYPFHLKRKTARMKKRRRAYKCGYRSIAGCGEVPSVPVKCIRVMSPTSLYLAGHSMIPTHNSASMIALADDLAKLGSPTAIFSLESRKHEISLRHMSMTTRIQHSRMRDWRTFSETDHERMREYSREISSRKLFIEDRLNSAEDILMELRRLKAVHGIKAAFIDYIQNVELRRRVDNREERLHEISRMFLDAANDLEIHIMAMSQLRDDAAKDGKRFTIGDLAYAKSIAKSARIVLFISRPFKLNPIINSGGENHADYRDPRHMDIQLEANNEGQTGDFTAQFDEIRQRVWEGTCEKPCGHPDCSRQQAEIAKQERLY